MLAVAVGGTALEYKTLESTANQITETAGSGIPTFSTPQDIGTSASPTVSGITSTGQAGQVMQPYGTAAGNTGEQRFLELTANGANYVGFKAPDNLAANKIWVLPATDGTSGQLLSTDGAGNLSWSSSAAGGISS